MPNKQLIFDHVDGCKFKEGFQSVLKPTDFQDVQGDILVPFPKRTEHFCFFTITNKADFKKALAKLIDDEKISTTKKVAEDRVKIAEWKDSGNKDLKAVENMNISFTYTGLKQLGLDIDKKPTPAGFETFKNGQLADAKDLGDRLDGHQKPEQWIKEFKDNHSDIHGALLIACESGETAQKCKEDIKKKLGEHIKVVYEFQGDVRSKAETKDGHSLKDHEHFGWKDGISNPWLQGVFCECRRLNGQPGIPPKIIILRDGPNWAHNGSYLVFRKLGQLVPEFNNFLKENAVKTFKGRTLSQEEGAKLRGAQFVGRWPMGTPLQTHDAEDFELAKNPQQNNDFTFPATDKTKCPFSAHIRKMNPREHNDDATKGHGFGNNFLVRQGITYGEEVHDTENQTGKTTVDRGLAFVSYQSNIDDGFRFQQTMWANNPGFPHTSKTQPGLDPLIGQVASSESFTTQNDEEKPIGLKQFVKPLGGVYCFTPSITTLKKLAGP